MIDRNARDQLLATLDAFLGGQILSLEFQDRLHALPFSQDQAVRHIKLAKLHLNECLFFVLLIVFAPVLLLLCLLPSPATAEVIPPPIPLICQKEPI